MNITQRDSHRTNSKSPALASLWLLTRFEYGRNTVRLSKSKGRSRRFLFSNRTWFTLAVITIVFGIIASSALSSPEKLPAIIWIPWVGAAISYVTSTASGTISTRQTDWWLSYPYPRWMLVLSKWMASTILGLRMFGIMATWGFFVYMVAWTIHPHSWMPTKDLLLFVALQVLTVVIYLPVLSAVGTFSLALARGIARIFQFLVSAALWGSFVASFAVMNVAKTNNFSTIVQGVGILFAVGWPISILLLWVTSRRLQTLAGTVGKTPLFPAHTARSQITDKTRNKTGSKTGSKTENGLSTHSVDSRTTPNKAQQPALRWIRLYEKFWGKRTTSSGAVFLLHASQMRWFGKESDLRAAGTAAIVPVLGFICGVLLNSQRLLLYVPAASLLVAAWILLWTGLSLFQRNLRKSAGWVLSFPVSRASLIVTLSLSTWIKLASFVVAGEAGLWLGIWTRTLFSPLSGNTYALSGLVMVKALFVFVTLLPILQIILQTASYALQGWWALLQLLVYGGLAGLFILAWVHRKNWLFPNLQTGAQPAAYWIILVLTIIIGYPLAIWFVRSASKNLHHIYLGTSLHDYMD
ncbi:hypothetical protein [Alicyclobacillus sp. SO9]|uniref:hypothetical protein n=1 Tax=Alicyclobacillus sp. SO9 TaxID=2665646 RepID=UPI0018E85351|nr:hypothetical protein [Alicyclobacillus sp. SO9]QQE78894.1 hypothetical protein GI364_24195 [Alicyclobacillus sp. SO9]